MNSSSLAYFLVAHGSRSPQTQAALTCLASYFQDQVSTDTTEIPRVATGTLEFQTQPLAIQLVEFCQTLPSSVRQVHLLPLFLLPGNHVREDLPAELAQAQTLLQDRQALGLQTSCPHLKLCPHLGSHPLLKTILEAKMSLQPADAWILMGHGSRRPEGNLVIEQLARQLKMTAAFWANAPSLADQVRALHEQGIRSIGVLPYFLFSGKITRQITADVDALNAEIPDLDLITVSPLNPSQILAQALCELGQIPTRLQAAECQYSGIGSR